MPEGPLLCQVVRGFLLLESVGVRLCFRPRGLLSFPEEETSVIWVPSQLLFCGGTQGGKGQRTEFSSVLPGSASRSFPSGRGLWGWEVYRTELCWHHAVLCFLNLSISKEETEAEKRKGLCTPHTDFSCSSCDSSQSPNVPASSLACCLKAPVRVPGFG